MQGVRPNAARAWPLCRGYGMPEQLDRLLADAAGDATAMAALRVMALSLVNAQDWSRCEDHVVIEHLAAEHVQGRWHRQATTGAKLYRLAPGVVSAPSPPPSAAQGPRAASVTPAALAAPVAPAATTFGAALDVAAMVAALQQASEEGLPFCEECARRAVAA